MPAKSYKKCNEVHCPELTRGTYCEVHQQEQVALKKQGYQDYKRDRQDKEVQAFYSSGVWRKVRVHQLSQHPLCKHCMAEDILTPAELVDHIIPTKIDWSLRLSLSNLQSLCQACHNRKSAEDRRKYPELR